MRMAGRLLLGAVALLALAGEASARGTSALQSRERSRSQPHASRAPSSRLDLSRLRGGDDEDDDDEAPAPAPSSGMSQQGAPAEDDSLSKSTRLRVVAPLSAEPLAPKPPVPNRLAVAESRHDDVSVVALSKAKMAELDLFEADVVLLKGRFGMQTVGVALADDTVADGEVGLSQATQRNAGCRKWGDKLKAYPCADIKPGKRVHVLPFKDSLGGFSGELASDLLEPFFRDAFRPVAEGDILRLEDPSGGGGVIECLVVETEPAG